ncbi:T-cell surface glycoprotein CD3 epsilon chain-like [Alosa pseudoharengus]|uniref:T-cell surface glycoprotein CD3 epsilon chain-like n=1 Tax=Alosa pseudoharengus TaxID=34774 RepID=UPI003F8B9F45
MFKMKNHIFNNIFFLFVMVGVTAGDKGSVSFSGKNVTVHCLPMENPDNDDSTVTFVKHSETITDVQEFSEEYTISKANGYSCQQKDTTTSVKFYIKAKVCEYCYELDPYVVAAAICADLLITGGIILLVYAYGQRKSGPAPPKPSNARNPAGSGGPPVPSPDYQPLSDFTRNRDTYATVHKTG